jgi:chemotaxis protein methyltransferase CheR
MSSPPTAAPSEADLDLLEAVNARLAQRIGLSFARERLIDLRRGLHHAARELGEHDFEAWARRLISSSLTAADIEILARHLTVGETYFFRDERSFEILREKILYPLIRERSGSEQSLRLWSAACSSGEEAYSLAILLHEIVPRIADWRITVLATDLNPDALKKARAAVYPQWSFRALPLPLKEKYFQQSGGNRWTLHESVRNLVKFAALNLVEDIYPSSPTDTHSMDVILCRNVLMYFADEPAQRVIGKLQQCLREGGYLLTSANEGPRLSYAPLVTHHLDGAIAYRKSSDAFAQAPTKRVPTPISTPAPPSLAAPAAPRVLALPAPPAPRRIEPAPATAAPQSAAIPVSEEEEARRLADAGQLEAALSHCDAALKADKFNTPLYYLRAAILLAGHTSDAAVLDEAAAALRQALYLDPDFLIAHLAAGNVARAQHKNRDAVRHFANARKLALAMKGDEIVPESEGLSAAQLATLLETLL